MERTPAPLCPRLLVSVRSATETREALAGGCDILDVKEPRNGSLGAASTSSIRNIADIGEEAGIPVSAALGECAEWQQSAARRLDLEAVSDSRLRFVKLGLAQMAHCEDWSAEWRSLIDWCSRQLGPATQHVAVIYADWQAARAPHPQAVLEALGEHLRSSNSDANFAGVLIDTFEKSSGRLLDAMNIETLKEIREQSSRLGLFLALAGRLNEESLPPLVKLAPDIVAVRSAACRGEDRNASVDRNAVSGFRAAMQTHFELLAGTAPVNDGVRHA